MILAHSPADVADSRSTAAEVVLLLPLSRLPSTPIAEVTPLKYRARVVRNELPVYPIICHSLCYGNCKMSEDSKKMNTLELKNNHIGTMIVKLSKSSVLDTNRAVFRQICFVDFAYNHHPCLLLCVFVCCLLRKRIPMQLKFKKNHLYAFQHF